MTIAVDFDGTVVEETENNPYPDFGDFLPNVVEVLKRLAEQGHTLILWTCRTGEEAQRVFQHCLNAGIPFKAVNQNIWENELHDYKKLNADLYIENKDVSFFRGGKKVDWKYIEQVITGEGDADILFKGEYVKIISPKAAPYEAAQCGDSVMVFLADTMNKTAFVRREHCPAYEYRTPFKYWYTPITGGIGANESPFTAAVREVKEETGVDVKRHDVEIVKLFQGKFNKLQTDNIHVFLIKGSNLKAGYASGDGTFYEKECTAVQVLFDEIKALKPKDYLLTSLWALAEPYIN